MKKIGIKVKGQKDISWQYMSEELFSRHGYKEGQVVQVEIVDVDDPYYKKARKFPDGHLVYFLE